MIPPDIERVALLGWHVYPHSRHSRAGCFEGAQDAATANLDQIEKWCREYPNSNWRVVFGPSGLWGLDLDRPPLHQHDGVALFAEWVKQHDPLPPRPMLRSGGGGLAVFFKYAGEPIRGAFQPPCGIDPRRGRQTQTIPPSVHHETGRPYVWAVAPWDIAPPVAPSWLLAAVAPKPEPKIERPKPIAKGDKARNYAVGALYQAVRRVATAGDGSRNNTLNAEAFSLSKFVADGSLGEEELRDALYHAATTAGLLARDALATIQSGLRAGRRG